MFLLRENIIGIIYFLEFPIHLYLKIFKKIIIDDKTTMLCFVNITNSQIFRGCLCILRLKNRCIK